MLILNKHKDVIPKEAIYVGRGSPYGNIFVIGQHGTRDEVIDKYEVLTRQAIINKDPIIIEAFKKLNKDSVLSCFCRPNRCHAEVIEKLWNEFFNIKTYDPNLDGVDHINIYSKAKTQLGRLLTNFAEVSINHESYGHFRTLEGFWQWLKTGKKHDIFRTIDSFQAKKMGREYPMEMPINFKQEFKKALLTKIENNIDLKGMLKESVLPFTHYYYYGDITNCKVVNVENCDWLLEYITLIRDYLNGKSHKLIIAGSRDITDYNLVKDIYLKTFNNSVEIISGTARGVDKLGEDLADELEIPKALFPAEWNVNGVFIKGAGHIRNKQMANYATALLAFWDGKSPGTKNMIETMKTLGKVVKVYNTETNTIS